MASTQGCIQSRCVGPKEDHAKKMFLEFILGQWEMATEFLRR